MPATQVGVVQMEKLFWPHGEQQLKTDTTQHTGNGRNFVVRETLITFNLLYMILSLSFHCYTSGASLSAHL